MKFTLIEEEAGWAKVDLVLSRQWLNQTADACLTTYLSILYILLRNPEEYIFGVSVITLE